MDTRVFLEEIAARGDLIPTQSAGSLRQALQSVEEFVGNAGDLLRADEAEAVARFYERLLAQLREAEDVTIAHFCDRILEQWRAERFHEQESPSVGYYCDNCGARDVAPAVRDGLVLCAKCAEFGL